MFISGPPLTHYNMSETVGGFCTCCDYPIFHSAGVGIRTRTNCLRDSDATVDTTPANTLFYSIDNFLSRRRRNWSESRLTPLPIKRMRSSNQPPHKQERIIEGSFQQPFYKLLYSKSSLFLLTTVVIILMLLHVHLYTK